MITPKEGPILMCAEMVRAVLRTDSPKTQTRRILNPQPWQPWLNSVQQWLWNKNGNQHPFHPHLKDSLNHVCPYGKPGDRLWVRETWFDIRAYERATGLNLGIPFDYQYRADFELHKSKTKWRPSIYMPRKASRITLEITDVRVERVQDITAEDCIAEGIDFQKHKCGCEACSRTSVICPATSSSLILAYAGLWDSLNAKRGFGWTINPFCWRIEFRRLS